MPALKVDDRKSSETKTYGSVNMKTGIVGSPVSNTVGHPHNVLANDRHTISKVELSADSTHRLNLLRFINIS
jgi:hypothetical protein